jgi:hypothetical protein
MYFKEEKKFVDLYVKYPVLLRRIANLGTGTSQLPQTIIILLFSVRGGDGTVALSA